MDTMKVRSLSAAERSKEAGRGFRFEVWREEPHTADRPYRRKTDRRTHMVWKNLGNTSKWQDVFALIKRGQRLLIRSYLRRGHYGHAGTRMIVVRIVNRKGILD